MKMAVTGHRPNKLWGYDYNNWQYQELKNIIKNIIIQHKITDLFCGMALGVDIISADVVIELNESGELDYHISLHCCIPCWRQESVWPEESRIHFYEVLGKCDEIVIVTKKLYEPKLMQVRNVYMVDSTNKLLAIWDGTSGGTGNCIAYASKMCKEIIYINPREIR